jgi:hypothetical protein
VAARPRNSVHTGSHVPFSHTQGGAKQVLRVEGGQRARKRQVGGASAVASKGAGRGLVDEGQTGNATPKEHDTPLHTSYCSSLSAFIVVRTAQY